MNRLSEVNYKGKYIIRVDLSNLRPEETLAVLPEAKKLIAAQPPHSALILTDVSNSIYTRQVSEEIKEFSKNNQPFVKASAVIGAEGVRLVLLTTVNLLTRREIKAFQTTQQALDWLAEH
jgi:hypothetical protein